jgi:hypothetical protein
MTSNQFDFFEGTRSESKTPQVTVRRSGQIVLTVPAVAMLGEGVTHVQFGWAADNRAVALRAAGEGAKGRYRLRAQTNGSSLVDSRRFLAHHGVELEKAETFAAEAFGSGIIGFRFDEAVVTAKSEPEAEVKTATPAAESKPARTGKRKATAAAA